MEGGERIEMSTQLIDKFLTEFENDINSRRQGSKASFSKAAQPLLTTVMDSTALRRQLADKFINLVVDESKLLQMASVRRVNAPSGDLTKLNINTHVTRKATENTAASETRRPTSTGLTYTTVKSVSLLDVTGEWTEDNIEGPSGRNTVVKAFTDTIANDMETLAIEGDDSEAGTDDYSSLIKINDGWHVLTGSGTGTNLVNCGGLRPSFQLLSDMLKSMPTKYKSGREKLTWLMSWGSAQALVDEFAGRVTAFGDQIRQTGSVPAILGIPVTIVPKIPEDLTLVGTAGTTGSFIWLCDPKNFIFVVQRDFKAEWERQPRSDTDELTIHMRTDFLVENTSAVVKATDVSVYQEHSFYS